jgi:spore coat protein U-like protein
MRSRTTVTLILLASPSLLEGAVAADGCPCGNGSEGLDIRTSVAMVCMVSTTAVAFGAYDPLSVHSVSPLDGTGGLVVHCTDDYNATITLSQGSHPLSNSTDAAPLRQMSDGGENRLQYFLYQDAARTIVWGNTYPTAICASGNITVYGTVSGGQALPVGTYLDVVVVTVDI